MTSIACFSNLSDADLAKSRLEAAGIPSFVPEESSAGWMLEGAAPIVTGVRLQVADADVARALDALEVLPPQTGADRFPRHRASPVIFGAAALPPSFSGRPPLASRR